MNQRRLLMDAGNTRLKWAVVEDGQWRAQGDATTRIGQALKAELTAGTDCFIASVAQRRSMNSSLPRCWRRRDQPDLADG